MCLYTYQNKQRLFLYMALTDWFFTAKTESLLCGTDWDFKLNELYFRPYRDNVKLVIFWRFHSSVNEASDYNQIQFHTNDCGVMYRKQLFFITSHIGLTWCLKNQFSDKVSISKDLIWSVPCQWATLYVNYLKYLWKCLQGYACATLRITAVKSSVERTYVFHPLEYRRPNNSLVMKLPDEIN
jgi:hypothetical protein